MNWWNKHKKTLSLFLAVCFFIGILLIVALMLLGPVIGGVFCKLSDCLGDGVHINFVGKVPENYTVEVEFPSGKRKIICNSAGTVGVDFVGDYCKDNGVFYEQIDSQEPSDLPPEELIVKIIYDGKEITKTFRPDYEIQRDFNGENCPPMCYLATIEFELSE